MEGETGGDDADMLSDGTGETGGDVATSFVERRKTREVDVARMRCPA